MPLNLASIVATHGGHLFRGGTEALIPGPGHSRRDRSLSLKVEGERLLWFSHSNDPYAVVKAYLGLDTGEDRPRISRSELETLERERAARRRETERRELAWCESVWRGSEPLKATAADAYLLTRKLDLTACADLRFHPAAPRSKPHPEKPMRVAPALLALVRDVRGDPRGLHATYVRPDGTGKAFGDRSRLMFGPVRAGAVRLFPIGVDGHLVVGEGIETAAAYAGLHGVPAWAALSTAGMASFLTPHRVKRLTIAADGDLAGLLAAKALRHAARCAVEIDAAPDGQDWADVWEAGK